MKLVITSIILFSISTITYAQEIGKWTGWQTYKCWPGIHYQLKLVQQLKSGEYEWYIQFSSTYSKKVSFTWIMGAASDQEIIRNGAYIHEFAETISPGEKPDENFFRLTNWVLVNSKNVFLDIQKMQFGETNINGPYAKCGSTKNDIPTSLQSSKKTIDPDAGLVAEEVDDTKKNVPPKIIDKEYLDKLKKVEHDIFLKMQESPEYFRIKNNRTAVIGNRG